MLATSAADLPSGTGWSFEFKWDGVRALVEVSAGVSTIRARSGNDITVAYPELAGIGADLDDALIDGEIVAFDNGRPSFGLLQTRMHVRSPAKAAQLVARTPVTFIAFDLLRLYGVDLTARPLHERRATLTRLAEGRANWIVSPTFDDGPATEAAAREHGLEGVLAKQVDSPYRTGRRTREWLKVKFVRRQEFVVIGWEADAGTPNDLSSLVLGYYDDGQLRLAGKVGSGLDRRVAQILRQRFRPVRSSGLEVDMPATNGRPLHWVRPDVVVEVGYTEWGSDGRLRHPVFAGIRTDKDPQEVSRDG
jgi:bifunctional non-homologous end joining protein LigD